MPIRSWSPNNDETNGDADLASGVNWQENQETSSVNNSSRSEMAEVRKYWEDRGATADSTGTGAAYEVTAAQAIEAPLVRGDSAFWKAHVSNTGACTLNINGIGGQPLRGVNGNELAAGQIQAGQIVAGFWDGSQFLALNLGAGTVTVDNLDANTRGLLNDIGDVKPWFSDTAPDGWLVCDGSAVSRTTYAQLFAAWGVRFGAGDGSNTFNLIDLRGQFLRGLDPTGLVDPDVASRTDRGDGVTGANVGTKQADQAGPHGHTAQAVLDHTHNLLRAGGSASPTQDMIFTALSGILRGTGASLGGNANLSIASAGGHTPVINALATSETRPVNIACNWIVLADAAAASGAQLNVAGLSGWGYTFDDSGDTGVDPGIGQVAINGPFATATEIAVSDQVADTGNADISSVYASLGNVDAAIKGTAKLVHASDTSRFTLHDVTAVNTAPTGYSVLTIDTPPTGFNGSFTAGEAIQVQITEAVPGEAGATGPTGPNLGLDCQWNTALTGDPGSGKASLSFAPAPSTAGTLRISKTNRQGKDQSVTIESWDDSSNPDNRGHVNIVSTADAGSDFVQMHISGNVVDQTTYYDIPIETKSVGDAIPNDEIIGILFSPAGDKGLDGAGSGDVVGPASSTPNAIAGYANATGKLLQNTPVTVDPGTGNMASIGSLTATSKVTGAEFDATGTSSNQMPVGTTGEEPPAVPGFYRYDATLGRVRVAIGAVWDVVATIATANAWSAGQKKTMVSSATWSTAWTLAGGLDYRVAAQVTTAIDLPLPTDAGTHLANLEGQEGTIWASFGAASGAGFNASYEFPGGTAPDVSAGGDFTFYYRVQKGDEVNDSNLHYYITNLGPWS